MSPRTLRVTISLLFTGIGIGQVFASSQHPVVSFWVGMTVTVSGVFYLGVDYQLARYRQRDQRAPLCSVGRAIKNPEPRGDLDWQSPCGRAPDSTYTFDLGRLGRLCLCAPHGRVLVNDWSEALGIP